MKIIRNFKFELSKPLYKNRQSKSLRNEINNQYKVSAICLSEIWLSSEYDTSLFEIQGYNLISAGKYCSPHSGLIIYLREDYNFEFFICTHNQ